MSSMLDEGGLVRSHYNAFMGMALFLVRAWL